MMWGVFNKQAGRPVAPDELKAMNGDRDGYRATLSDTAGFAALDATPFECDIAPGGAPAAFQGALANADDLRRSLDLRDSSGPALLIAKAHAVWGADFAGRLEGKFAFALADSRNRTLLLGRDRFGMEPLYFFEDGDRIVFGTRLGAVASHPRVGKRLHVEAMHQFLLFCYNPTSSTFFEGIHKAGPARVLVFANGKCEARRYWRLSFGNARARPEGETAAELHGHLERSVRKCLDVKRPTGVFLSGGMDSSTVTALAGRAQDAPLWTFSYRCLGVSFDESHYANTVSDFFGTRHALIEYSPETVLSMEGLAGRMDEPFCDVGINLATDILGRAASGKVNLVLTGDGGDELFGGHPVYQADRAAAVFDRMPAFMKMPLIHAGSRLSDSDKKKDWKVKWKRFARSVAFPAALFSHRWRVYYTPEEMRDLLHPDLAASNPVDAPFAELLGLHAETGGMDGLSRSIYSDYQTVVSFYLRRMDLIRHYGIEVRYPLLDRSLVEFCAALPSGLKIRGGDVKYIFKRAMEKTLPHEIVHRKDKLGHSIPLKNWMRDDASVRGWMLDILSESSLKKRGFFNAVAVARMIREHLSKRDNHSHRLWALMVLELWMRKNID
jgi:asparagine synthase (glutamine-hydrolysing)